jgi:hypothetical protein
LELTSGRAKTTSGAAAAVTAGRGAAGGFVAGVRSCAAVSQLGSALAADSAVMAISPVTTAATPSCLPRLRSGGSGRTDARRRPLMDGSAGMARRRPCLRWESKMWDLSAPAMVVVGFGRVSNPSRPDGCNHQHAEVAPSLSKDFVARGSRTTASRDSALPSPRSSSPKPGPT